MSVVEYEVGKRPGPPARERVEVDPVTLRVLGGAFHAIAKEMAGVLFRMSYSSIIRESEDLGAGIFDAEGRELCESDSTPMHIGSLPWYIRGFLHRLDGQIEDGDVIVHNHPYLGASHSPDVAVAVPIFHDDELLGFAAVTAHVLDVGGSFPGINADAFDVYAEAKMYNALRWYQRGVLNEDLDRMIFDNVRTETMNRGDMNAMLAACQLGRDRFLRLIDRYGVDVVMSAAYDWMDYSERMLRQEIEKIPDGTYGPVIGWLDDDARNRGERLRVETRVVVEGDEITIDLTGSNPEVPTGDNVPGTRAAERRRLPSGQGDRTEGDDLQPELPAGLLLALLSDAARRRQRQPRARRRAAGQGHGRQLRGHPLLRLRRVRRVDGGVLALPRGERGLVRRPLRQGRDGLGRQPDGQHPQQPDRGARHALPDAVRSVRAAARAGRARPLARRRRDHQAQPLPRRRHLLVRRRPADRPAAGRVRRLGRPRCLVSQEPRHEPRGEPAREGDRDPVRRRRVHRVPRAERRGVRRTARPPRRRRARGRARRLHDDRARARRLRGRLRRRAHARDRHGGDGGAAGTAARAAQRLLADGVLRDARSRGVGTSDRRREPRA